MRAQGQREGRENDHDEDVCVRELSVGGVTGVHDC